MLNSHSAVNILSSSPTSSVTSLPTRRMPDWLQASLFLGSLLLCRQAAVSSIMPASSKTAVTQTSPALFAQPLRQLTPHIPVARPDARESERSIVAQSAADMRLNRCTRLPLATLGAGGADFAFTFVYNSRSRHLSELGSGWTHSLDITGVLDPQANAIRVHWGDDSNSTFQPVKTAQGFIGKAAGTSDTLKTETDGTYTITRQSGVRYHLDHRLCCDRIHDANGHTLTLERNLFGCVTRTQDGEGRELRFSYVCGNHLMAIQDNGGRRWLFHFAPRCQTLDLTDIVAAPIKGAATCTHIDYDADDSITVVHN